MENRKHVKFLVPIFILGLFIFQNNIAFAYDVDTHAYLTSEVVKFYNQNFPNSKISNELNDYLIDGSRKEDDVPRPMNHFYDPVNNRGLVDSTLGSWQKSKDWSQDSNNQNKSTYKVPATVASILTAIQQRSINLITDETDFTWQRAIKFYVAGDKEKAMFILGHILHLIEDASVPEHTRNDIHLLTNPYENYTDKFSIYSPDSKLTQKLANKGPINLDSLNSYFDNLANYSNNNFYSVGTIGVQSGYEKPVPADYEKINELYYALNSANDSVYKLSVQPTRSSVLMNIDGIVSIDDRLVLDNYWSLLSVKSIQYGAGVINLFFQEVEKAKNDPNFNTTEEKSFIGKAVEATSNFIAQVSSTANNIVSSAGNFLTGIFKTGDNFQQVGQIDLSQSESQNLDKNSETQSVNKELTPKSNEQINQTKDVMELDENEIVLENGNQDDFKLDKNLKDKVKVIPATTVKQCPFDTIQTLSRQKVIINEVAWMGSSNSANDEWIELKNISGGDIDISGWQLVDKDEQIKINFASIEGGKIVGPNRILLFERTDDDSVLGIKADLIYSGALSNTNEGLRLFDEQCNLVDEISADPDWPAGNSSERKTTERDIGGFNWHTSNIINGTPKAENSGGLITSKATQVTYSGGGGSSSNQNQQLTQAKILINEVQISPAGSRFIKLYNPNNSDVNLTNWYIQRKTKTGSSFSSLVSKTYFENKTISAKNYFLISRSATGADAVVDDLTLTEANSIQIKNSNGDVSDKVGWGDAIDCEGSCASEPAENQSIKRKSQNGAFVDTDNNANDFEVTNIQATQSDQAPSAFFDYSPKSLQVGQTVNFNASSSTDPGGQEIVSYEWSFGDGGTLISANPTASHIYSRFGNYQASLVVFNTSGVSSTPATANIPVSISGADHVVISEILFKAQGDDEGKEFIELYNPTNSDVNLSDYSLEILTGDATSTDSLAKFGSKAEDGILIKSKSFFLIGFHNYIGSIPADITRASSLPNSSSTIYLLNSNGGKVDSAFYDSMVNDGQSLERKAWVDSSCALSQENGEFSGNGCDSNSVNDFDIRMTPNPQNSLSLPEPRVAPTKPENFNIQYNQSGMEMNFQWNEAQDYLGTSLNLTYKIFDISNASATLPMVESTSTAAKIIINEIGRDYQVSIKAFDKDGLGSEAATSSINISSFLSGLYFYQNFQDGEVLIDAYYGQYPFVPDLFGKGDTWKIAVFYLNSDAKNDLNNPSWQPNDITDVLGLKYNQCAGGTGGNSLILPDVSNNCGMGGGAANVSFSNSQLEDKHFIIKTAKSIGELNLDGSDFITTVFYSVSSISPSNPLSPDFQLVAKDKIKYYFGAEPSRQSPVFNGEIVKDFDSVNSKLNLFWPRATDIDTLDNLLTYEIKYNDEDWISAGNATGTSRFVSPGENFSISVRARDDSANYSVSTLLENWSYPPINFGLVQEVGDSWSDNFGQMNWNGISGANIQSILPAGNLEFNKFVLKVKHSQDTGSSFDLKLSVFGNKFFNGQNVPDFNNLISASTISGLSGDPQNRDLVFSFSSNIVLSAGVRYWFVLENSSYTFHSYNDLTSNSWQNAISAGDVYPDGESGRAFMRISGTNGTYIDGSAEINSAVDWYMKIGLGE
ncbi:MAG: lamin tail domain-containing protein [Candidatus Paceibacterota bacterium]